jgi:uncharacterized protein DUF937/PRC-barrel domain protein
MSTNLVSTITQVLSSNFVSRVASSLGLDGAQVEKALQAGAPALLAALTSLVSKPAGAAALNGAVAQQQPGVLTSLANMIGGSGQKALIDTGVSTLTSLLGGKTTSALTNAVGQYAGIGEGSSKSLMGVLGPIVLGVLGQQQRTSGLDATGLANLLASQKDNIARALPAGFASYLGGTGILDRITGPTARPEPAYAISPSTSMTTPSWLLPALGILAIGALAWYLLSGPATQTVATLPTKVETPAQMPGKATFIVREDEAKNWIGRPVYSSDNKKIGEIIEIKRDSDNKVTELYVDTGSFLGIGATRYRVTSEQIQEVKPDGLVLTLKESEVKAVPQAGENQR